MVDLDDVTDVAATVLQDSEAHAYATYELVGPGQYNAHQLGRIISAVLERDTQVQEIDADTYLKAWFGDADQSEFPHEVRVLRSITRRYSNYDFLGNPNVLAWLLGRPPTTFEQFVRKEYAKFKARS